LEPQNTLSFDEPFPITDGMRERFRRDGFIKIKNVLSAGEIARIEPVITALVEEYKKGASGLKGYDLKQFVQVVGLWRRSEAVRQYVFSKRFARMAADLMGVRAVRLYTDQAFYKPQGGAPTVPHQDLTYWPLATENACAVWIPFQSLSLEMGPLGYYRGSHLPFLEEGNGVAKLGSAGRKAVQEAFELGEVGFHFGWTWHTAHGNRSDRIRKAHSINFFEDGTRLRNPTSDQMDDWKTVCPQTRPGEVIEGPLTPVLWSY